MSKQPTTQKEIKAAVKKETAEAKKKAKASAAAKPTTQKEIEAAQAAEKAAKATAETVVEEKTGDLEDRVKALEDAESLEDRVKALEDAESLEDRVKALEDAESLEAGVKTLEGEIKSASEAWNKHDSRLDAIEDTLSKPSAAPDLSGIESRLDALESPKPGAGDNTPQAQPATE